MRRSPWECRHRTDHLSVAVKLEYSGFFVENLLAVSRDCGSKRPVPHVLTPGLHGAAPADGRKEA